MKANEDETAQENQWNSGHQQIDVFDSSMFNISSIVDDHQQQNEQQRIDVFDAKIFPEPADNSTHKNFHVEHSDPDNYSLPPLPIHHTPPHLIQNLVSSAALHLPESEPTSMPLPPINYPPLGQYVPWGQYERPQTPQCLYPKLPQTPQCLDPKLPHTPQCLVPQVATEPGYSPLYQAVAKSTLARLFKRPTRKTAQEKAKRVTELEGGLCNPAMLF